MSRAAQGVVRLPAWRARALLGGLLLGFAALSVRAAYLQTVKTDFLREMGDARYSRVLEIPATRGRILDREGEALAVSTPVKSIWAIPADVKLGRQAERQLSSLLKMSPSELEHKLADASREFVYLKRQVAPETAEASASFACTASTSSASIAATTRLAKSPRT